MCTSFECGTYVWQIVPLSDSHCQQTHDYHLGTLEKQNQQHHNTTKAELEGYKNKITELQHVIRECQGVRIADVTLVYANLLSRKEMLRSTVFGKPLLHNT